MDKDLSSMFRNEFVAYLFIQLVSTVVGAAFLWVFMKKFVDGK